MRWRVIATVIAIPGLVALSLLNVPVRQCDQSFPSRMSDKQIALYEELMSTATPEGREHLRRVLTGELHVWDEVLRKWQWERKSHWRPDRTGVAWQRIEWPLAWWQPLPAILLGGVLLTWVVRRERRRRAAA